MTILMISFCGFRAHKRLIWLLNRSERNHHATATTAIATITALPLRPLQCTDVDSDSDSDSDSDQQRVSAIVHKLAPPKTPIDGLDKPRALY